MSNLQSQLATDWRNRLAPGFLPLSRFDELPGLRRALTLVTPSGRSSLLPVPHPKGENWLEWTDGGIDGEVTILLTTPAGAAVGDLHMAFDPEDRTLLIQHMALDNAVRGNGLGRQAIRNLVELSTALGLQGIKLNAFDLGRYVWAICGFDFWDDHARSRAVDAAEALARRLGRPFDAGSVEHSWDLATAAGEAVELAEVAPLRGASVAPGAMESWTFGQALLLGPAGNEWNGLLDLQEGSASLAQLGEI